MTVADPQVSGHGLRGSRFGPLVTELPCWSRGVSDFNGAAARCYPSGMNSGKYVLTQLLDWIHPQQFQRCVARYGGDAKVSQFSCWSQFVCLDFAQLTWRESLRDIEACLNLSAAIETVAIAWSSQ